MKVWRERKEKGYEGDERKEEGYKGDERGMRDMM